MSTFWPTLAATTDRYFECGLSNLYHDGCILPFAATTLTSTEKSTPRRQSLAQRRVKVLAGLRAGSPTREPLRSQLRGAADQMGENDLCLGSGRSTRSTPRCVRTSPCKMFEEKGCSKRFHQFNGTGLPKGVCEARVRRCASRSSRLLVPRP